MLAPSCVRPRFLGRVGDVVDAIDSVGKWCEAVILDVKKGGGERTEDVEGNFSVFVHYLYWDKKYDAWLRACLPAATRASSDVDAKSDILRFGEKTYQECSSFTVGQRIDVLDVHPAQNKWTEGEVIAIDGSKVKVHFRNWAAKYDEWLSNRSRRLKPFGRETRREHPDHTIRIEAMRSEARHALGRSAPNLSAPRQRQKPRLELARAGDAACASALASSGWSQRKIDADGNCLFRSISHQLYGTDKHHSTLRALCMDYMESEQAYFEPFVAVASAGDDPDSFNAHDAFSRYVKRLRKPSVWGDEPEIQALCELFSVSASVYEVSPSTGALRLLRRFQMPPAKGVTDTMRLLYLGRCHYDSIVDTRRGAFKGLLPDHRRCPVSGGAVASGERARIQLSRDRRAGDVDLALRLSEKDAIEQRQIDEAIRLSRMHFDTAHDSEDDVEKNMITTAIAISDEDADLERALRASRQDHDDALERALRESINTPSASESASFDIAASEDALMQQAMRASMDGFDTEDAMLQMAMSASLADAS